jgi:diaminopimelate epimerase
MCGNGLRCVALALVEPHGARSATQAAPEAAEFLVDTDAGLRHCRVELEPGAVPTAQVTTNMGRAELQGELAVDQSGHEYCFSRVSMGNPHAIRFGAPESTARVDELGPLVSGQVPGGSNVEFARVLGERDLEVVVWERGVGRTLACGTGAAATAVAAALAGHVPFDAPITVRLPGGPLEISVARETLEVELRGPARWVFSGEWGFEGEWAR